MNRSLILIEGSHLDKAGKLFQSFGYEDRRQDRTLSRWKDVEEVLERDWQNWKEERYHKIIWEQDGWTVLEDPELILCFEEESLGRISQGLGRRVLCTVDQSGSGGCGFWYYQGEKKLGIYVLNGELVEDFGVAEVSPDFSEKDLIMMLKAFGFHYKKTQRHKKFLLKTLSEHPGPDHDGDGPETDEDLLDPKKWWQFWK